MKAIKCDLIIDGTGKEPIRDGVILIDGDKIELIGTKKEVDIPLNTEIIDCSNNTILPGLIDPHRHLCGSMDERPFYEKPEAL